MKKNHKRASQTVTLVLITSLLSACTGRQENEVITQNPQKVFMRADSTAPYTDVTENYAQNQGGSHMGGMSTLLWFMAFRSLTGGMGYASQGLHQQSNVGTNTAKSNAMKSQAIRGGFGSSANNKSASS